MSSKLADTPIGTTSTMPPSICSRATVTPLFTIRPTRVTKFSPTRTVACVSN